MALDLTLVGKPTDPHRYDYTWKDAVLYALGVGAKVGELDYLYEGRGPKVLPSFAVVPKFPAMMELMARSGGDLATLVHSGEKVEVLRPFAPSGTLYTRAVLRAVYDLRRFATALIDAETTDASGAVVARSTSSILFRSEGGFGGEPPPRDEREKKVSPPKDAPPAFRVEERTSPEQALLYRLSGDFNPLHADPEMARSVGFERGPILHGLCTLGTMVRHVAHGGLAGDASRVVAFEAQFRRPVWPGDTLVTEGWPLAPVEPGGRGRFVLGVSAVGPGGEAQAVLANASVTVLG